MSQDAAARRRALDPGYSFIVQAPAGSGKTTLLVQRLLALLATAEQPEEVVAITFTRKAAAEMRQRVIEALRRAGSGVVPAQQPERLTFDLALAVLHRDREMGWDLLNCSGRLKVDTIDALNLWLAERLPMLSGAVAGLELIDDARGLYRQAARLCLGQLPDSAPIGASLRRLLAAFDNKAEQLEALLVTLLPRRDRWLHYLAPGMGDATLRNRLEAGLSALVERELARARQVLQQHGASGWLGLVNHAGRHATKGDLQAWVERSDLPEPKADQLVFWRGLAELFLTQKGEWRKRADKNIGFPSSAPEIKADFKDLLAELSDNASLLETLNVLRGLPEPHYDNEQWQLLLDLREVAITTAAQLKLVFQQRGECDFVELAGSAQRALGDLEQPSDLLLALDHRIRHLLVDEFQDTSHGQFELLSKLTAGWEDGDGRTLFLVGDPMQSIYRFRDADMSLFLKVRAQGLGNVNLESLVLRRNFRSQAGLIEWVNATFEFPLMPAEDDLSRGAAAFVASDPVRAESGGPQLRWLDSAAPTAEVNEAVRILAAELQRDPEQSIAVLVQSRTHLAGLRDRLDKQGIPAHAVDIDPLHRRQIIQDLLGLTRALSHRLDRIAWLGLLRAPWCGVSLEGLAAICEDLPADAAIYDAIQELPRRGRLNQGDRECLERTLGVLMQRFERAGDQSMATWVEDTWFCLGGPRSCLNPYELEDAQRFFRELAVLERVEGIADPLKLEGYFEALTNLDFPTGSGVEIMTIHRAKGLEFDTVLLMGLGRALRGDDAQALRWLELDRLNDAQPLLAPLSVGENRSRLYEYIRTEDRARDDFELYRRLYVALTRARERLYLLGHVGEEGEPDRRSALARLWPALGDDIAAIHVVEDSSATELADQPPPLRRFRDDVGAAGFYQPRELVGDASPEFEWVGQPAVLVGTAVHEWLMTVARDGVDQWQPEKLEHLQPHIRRQLALGGLRDDELALACDQVSRAVQLSLEDPRGRWCLQSHNEAESELKVAVWNGSSIERLVIDRTFVEDGTRWIIDYKTSTHEGADLEGFIRSEVERYQAQLERYASALRAADSRPIKVALYFPLLGVFESWPAGELPVNSA